MALTLVGCDAQIGTIVAKPGYFSDPRRIFLIDSIDPFAGTNISVAFRAGMRDGLARCGIASADFKTSALELNRQSRFKDEVAAFHPDLLVRIETRNIRFLQTAEGLTYWIGAWDPLRDAKNEVWSARINTVDIGGLVDRGGRGTEMAEKVIKQMTADRMLPACAGPHSAEAGLPVAAGASSR